jgi:hypothetical protein
LRPWSDGDEDLVALETGDDVTDDGNGVGKGSASDRSAGKDV